MAAVRRVLAGAALVLGLAAAGWTIATRAAAPETAMAKPAVFALRLQGAIGPATALHVQRGFERAAAQGAQLVVLSLDTPGGLDLAMRDIIKTVLASPVPVVGFVEPQGARAASAGTYILYACHVAAMAPATNLGAATPIEIGLPAPGRPPADAPPRAPPGGAASAPPAAGAASAPPADAMAAKRVHDAAAYMRALAQLRGRNAEWAERAVREAVSLTARDALAQQVVDVVAEDLPDLLRQLDGRVLRSGGREFTLATAGAPVVRFDPDWRGRLLAVISDPSVALVLLMLGVYGLLFEFMNPGFVVPGVIGGVCLLLALFALQMLPINYAGLALIVLGIAFLVAEAFLPSFGILGIGGVAAFVFGALLLVDTESPEFGVPRALIAGLALTSAAVVLGIASMAAKARRRVVVGGSAAMVGATGELVETDGHEGWATIQGTSWRVRTSMGLRRGDRVRVLRAEGLTLDVEPDLDQEREA